MLPRFRKKYQLRSLPDLGELRRGVDAANQLRARWGGVSVEGGLYRIHSEESAEQAEAWVRTAFPQTPHGVALFGFDWLGRQFGVEEAKDGTRVLLFDVGAGEALALPIGVDEFHEVELVDDPDAAVASAFFAKWRKGTRSKIALNESQCVGYRVPLFLGGRDELENLEVTDLEVYWELTGQLLAQVKQ